MEFHTSRWRMAGLMLLGLSLAVMSFLVTTLDRGLRADIVGWFGVLFFGATQFLGIRQLRRKGPSIIIDERGFEDVRWKIGPFRWEDVTAVWVAKIYGTSYLCLAVQDPEAYIRQLSPARQKFARATQATGVTPFSFAFSGLTPGLKEAMAYLQTHWPEKLRQPAPPR